MKVETTKKWDLKAVAPFISKFVMPDADILYHYTSVDALFGGIIVKDSPQPNKEICLLGTNCLYMNDPEELNTGIQLAHEVLNIPSNKSIELIREQAKNNVCLVSFSSAIDCLPMWGMYGKNGHGLAIGFDTSVLEKTFSLSKCIYATEANKEWLKREISKLIAEPEDWWKQPEGENILSKIFESTGNMLSIYILLWVLGKNPAYEYEQEVRWFFPVHKGIKYRLRDNLIVPYVEIYLPKSVIKEIWIGPTNDMDRATRSLRTYLDHMGFNEVEIKQSKVPYRD